MPGDAEIHALEVSDGNMEQVMARARGGAEPRAANRLIRQELEKS